MANLAIQRLIYKYCVQKPRVNHLLSRLGAGTTLNKAVLCASPDPLESQAARQRLLSSPSTRAQWAVYDHEIGGRTVLDKIQHFMFDIKPGEPASVVLGMTMGGEVAATFDPQEIERTREYLSIRRDLNHIEPHDTFLEEEVLLGHVWRKSELAKILLQAGKNDEAQRLQEENQQSILWKTLNASGLKQYDSLLRIRPISVIELAKAFAGKILALLMNNQYQIDDLIATKIILLFTLIKDSYIDTQTKHSNAGQLVKYFLGEERGEAAIREADVAEENILVSYGYPLINELRRQPEDYSGRIDADFRAQVQEKLDRLTALLAQDPEVANPARIRQMEAYDTKKAEEMEKKEEEEAERMDAIAQKIRDITEAITSKIAERLGLEAGQQGTTTEGSSGAYGSISVGLVLRLELRHQLKQELLPGNYLDIEVGDTFEEMVERIKTLNFLAHHEVGHLIQIQKKLRPIKISVPTSFNERKAKAQAKEVMVDKLAFEAARTIFVYTEEDSKLTEQAREAIAIEAHLTLCKIILRTLEAGKHTLPDECILRLAAVQLELAGSQAIPPATRDEINHVAATLLARVNKEQEEIDQLVDAYRQIFRSVRLPD